MPHTTTCDLAIWDLQATLAASIRRQMTDAREQRAAHLIVRVGRWRKRMTVVGRPRLVTAAAQPTPREMLGALVAAHRPRLLVVVGPAAARTDAYALNAIEVETRCGTDPTNSGERLASGVLDSSDSRGLTTDWADGVRDALASLGVDARLVAVVTDRLSSAGSTAATALRTKNGRQPGRRVVGELGRETDALARRFRCARRCERRVGDPRRRDPPVSQRWSVATPLQPLGW